ncbi:MAG: hypothetical protein Q8Q09_08545 [Deltaproteobacteria bacterium]|nr:hypothetical protein [Deltaproteobacteria bacterium]
MSNYTYRLRSIDSGFLAECCEMSVTAEGLTEDEALSGLRSALVEKLTEPNAVAPPAKQPLIEVSLKPAPAPQKPGPQGPGEAM